MNYIPPEPEYATDLHVSEPIGLPHSREAEEAVVGGVLINPDTYLELASFLCADEFYIHRLRFIWTAFERLVKRQVPIDSLTVSEELDDMGRLDEIGGPAYLTALLNQVPTTLHCEAYGQIIKATSIRRRLLVAGNEIATLAYDESEPIESVISGAEQAVFGVTDRALKQDNIAARKAVSDLYDHVDNLCKAEKPPGMLTGLQDFDALLGGFVPGTSGLVGARPGKGKSALLLTCLQFIETRKNPPAIVLNDMEMTAKGVMGRIAAMISGVSAEKIRFGKLTDEDWPAFNHAIEVIGDWPLIIIDERDPLALFPKIKHMHRRGECDLLINDYVGQFEAKAESRVRQVGIASKILSKIAKKIEIPVVTAAQVSRTIDTRGKDSELVLADLKESGDLEQDANWVLFLNPDENATMQNIRHCHLAKNRDGKVGRFELLFRDCITKFETVTTRKIDIESYRDVTGEKDD